MHDNSKPFSLEELNDGSKVELRGFIYKDGQGRVFLSNEPNLKTCCVGKKGLQIELKGFNSDSNFAVVQGILEKEKLSLVNVKEVEQSSFVLWLIIALFFVAVTIKLLKPRRG